MFITLFIYKSSRYSAVLLYVKEETTTEKRKTSYCPTLTNITEFRTDLKVMGKNSPVDVCMYVCIMISLF